MPQTVESLLLNKDVLPYGQLISGTGCQASTVVQTLPQHTIKPETSPGPNNPPPPSKFEDEVSFPDFPPGLFYFLSLAIYLVSEATLVHTFGARGNSRIIHSLTRRPRMF